MAVAKVSHILKPKSPVTNENRKVDTYPYSDTKIAYKSKFATNELYEICKCESGLNQFDEDGNVLLGRVNNLDTGICQINKYYWLDKAIELGYDIDTLDGNIEMANWIYNTAGSTPWSWSKSCWGK